MSNQLFKNRTVVITNAHDELGYSCALLYASLGASLVVNYPPDGNHERKEIFSVLKDEKNSGMIIETFENLIDSNKIVEAAISRFNSIHILINVASFKDGENTETFQEDKKWDSMLKSVMLGTFRSLKAAWPHFREQNFGSVIQVLSQSLEVSSIQSSARFALIGLTQTLAREGAKYNIGINCLVPKETSFVTGNSFALKSLNLNQLGLFVAGISSKFNAGNSGSIFEYDEEGVSKLFWERTSGILLNPDLDFTVGAILENWSELNDFSNSDHPTSAADFGQLLSAAQTLPPKPKFNDVKFMDKVVIVTGASSGLGRCYSLAFAKRGAKVVASDITDPTKVVDEIISSGGQAIGCLASVEKSDLIINKAIDTFGRVDILINNAGFLRDKSFVKMDEKSWNEIIGVHLNGAYQMTRSVWPYFLKQGFGRVVNTSSTSGIYGNFGQSNYSAAKLGILGLSDAAAQHGMQHNIHVNTIAPVASTELFLRALGDTNDKNKQAVFKPEYVVPMVLALCMDEFPAVGHPTGCLFEIGCGWQSRTRLWRSPDHRYRMNGRTLDDTLMTLEPPIEQLSIQQSEHSTKTAQSRDNIRDNIERLKHENMGITKYRYTEQEVILYNLAVGTKRSEIKFIFEGAKDFQAIPTFGLIPFFSPSVISCNADILPNFKPSHSLLGEHYLEILQYPIPTSGLLISTQRLVEVLDKGSSAISLVQYDTTDTSTGMKLFRNEVSFFMREAGNFGGQRAPLNRGRASHTYSIPPRQPDEILQYQTSQEQAALYRLTGDKMEMHIDPEFSKKGGFDIPILHGACSMGIAGKHLYQKYGPYRSIKVRFVGPVLPGQTLRTEMWKDTVEQGLIVFQVTVVETGKLCIAGGGAHLLDESLAAKL